MNNQQTTTEFNIYRESKEIKRMIRKIFSVIKQKRLHTPQIHMIFSDICLVKKNIHILDVQIQGVKKLPISV